MATGLLPSCGYSVTTQIIESCSVCRQIIQAKMTKRTIVLSAFACLRDCNLVNYETKQEVTRENTNVLHLHFIMYYLFIFCSIRIH